MWRILFILIPLSSLAQGPGGGYSNYRVVGAQGPGALCLYCGGSKIYANSNSSDTSSFSTERLMWSNGANISSSSGKLLFYTNGWSLMDRNGQVVPNGDSLSPTPISLNNLQYGNNFPQNSFIFQHSEDSSLYTMVHTTKFQTGAIGPLTLWKSTIKINADSSLSMVEKNTIIISDTIEMSGINGCKHANGRDWWVIVKERFNSNYYALLFTPDSMYISRMNMPGSKYAQEVSAMKFSNDGKYYATYSSADGLRVYQFDRCSGQFEFLSYINDPQNGSHLGISCCFSPNGKYIYFNTYDKIHRVPVQSSLSDNDVELVREYTLFIDTAFGFNVYYLFLENSNDGKLYLGSTNSSRFYCTIDNPDAEDIANIGYHHFNFKIPYFNNHTYTNHANYTLGPLAGSPCDTLGLGKKGLLNNSIAIEIYPNPNKGNFAVNYSPQAESGMLYIYDMNGHVVFNEYIAPWSNIKNINLEHKLSNGIYAINLVFGNMRGLEKFVIKR
ncbi:MAG: T9SS type A sorting domain-containing protein [Bacteroidia bacterium]|nr:T9SS type A sorting domain-containing protein [Bacteroidia bacterium]